MEEYIKRRYDAPAGLFQAEAAGLAWLRVSGGVPAVEVLAVDDHSITLEWLRTVPATTQAAEDFGRRLAFTHDAGAEAFGSPPAGYTGPSFIADLPMTTDPQPTWGVFFASQRIWTHALASRRDLGSDGLKVMEKLADRLAEGIFDDEAPPARLHGDLWSGNVLFTAAGATLIDPSAHGGHRISDLAMLSLFGAPHLERIFSAYEETSSHLPDGWRHLIALHQVYPLLVHTVLFGGGYAHQAVTAACQYL